MLQTVQRPNDLTVSESERELNIAERCVRSDGAEQLHQVELTVGVGLAEQVVEMRPAAPLRRRWHAGGRRHVLADGFEELADEAFRRPVCKADREKLTTGLPVTIGV